MSLGKSSISVLITKVFSDSSELGNRYFSPGLCIQGTIKHIRSDIFYGIPPINIYLISREVIRQTLPFLAASLVKISCESSHSWQTSLFRVSHTLFCISCLSLPHGQHWWFKDEKVQVLYFSKEYKWSYTFQKHIEYIQVSMGRKAEKAMLISLLTSGELKKYTQKNARYMKHKKLEHIFTQTLLWTHSLYANMNTYSMYHNHIF